MGDVAFVVRALPSTGLKGAFRVHISPEALTQSGLKVGELCSITSEEGIRGAGIAWRALDKMGSNPKQQTAKMSETLRDAWGFKQGSQVRIEKASFAGIAAAKRVSLIEISPAHEGPGDNCWKNRCIAAFTGIEAMSVGTSFDVTAEGGLKRRYCIEQIEFNPAHEGAVLSCFDDNSELQILDGPLRSPVVQATTQRPLQINAAAIGGLQHQIDQLNMRLRMLCSQARSLHSPLSIPWNQGVLVHGYEGTGKSLVLDALAKTSGLKKAVRFDNTQALGIASKNQAYIRDIFQDALSSQPSLIVIDDIDHVAPAGDGETAVAAMNLASALDSLAGTQVLVVASARSPLTLHNTLLAPGRLEEAMELPIPNIHGRRQILRALLAVEMDGIDELVRGVADKTHGFTGSDLRRLVSSVLFTAGQHMVQRYDDWFATDIPERPATLDDDAATLVDRPATPEYTFTNKDFEAALQTIRPSALREIIVEPPKITFDDIGGSAGLQSRFDRIIKWPIQNPEIFRMLPEKKPRRGVLLYGPPGCSKTMTAQAVASTYGWNFIAVKGAELISMYVGESERAIREIFRKARQAAPTIIFFDEIDSIATTRSSSTDAGKSLNVVTTLLNEMDGFEAARNVLVLAATNKPESLDPAILRPGRFDEHVYLGPPTYDARKEILRICTKGAPMQTPDLDSVAEQTEGMSGAEIKHAWSLACDLAIERVFTTDGELKITTDDLLAAVSKTRRGITKDMLDAYEIFARRDYAA